MQPTAIGLILIIIGGLIAVTGSTAALMSMLMLCGLMSGSAAIVLPALGGSSIPPIQVAIGFLSARVLLSTPEHMSRLRHAVQDSWALVAYVFYALAASYVLPRIFAGAIQVPPLRFAGLTYIYDTVALAPTSQNITTAVYLVGTLMTALCVHVAISHERGPRIFIYTAVTLAWIHIVLGVVGVAVKGTPLDGILNFFRNGSYAQVDQSYGGFIRLTGIAPEPSVYAAYAFSWFVLIFECWMRGIWPRWTGITSIALLSLLVCSTSGLGYVSLAVYAFILLLRLLLPGSVMGGKMVVVTGGAIGLMTLIAVVFIVSPALTSAFSDMIVHMTVDKGDSYSGLQRAFWAKKGLEAFRVSYGLGIGPGSFRSSSLATAILGSVGVIGTVTFLIHILSVLKPWRQSTYSQPADPPVALGAAASWAAFADLIPAAIGAASCDPGTNFAIFSGVALALRAHSAVAYAPPAAARLRQVQQPA